MSTWSQLGLQDAASPVMEEFIFFHDFAMSVLVGVTFFVGVIMALMLANKSVSLSMLEGQMIECVWTIAPAVVLLQVAVPSLLVLYMLDECLEASLTLKVTGHQWYWSYEYSDFWSKDRALEFDSYMVPAGELEGLPRLLEVDNRTVVPSSATVRALIGSSDVLHSWAVPSLGVKADACPGRLNQVKFMCYRPGVYYGQCSEICGANHSFMPIAVEAVPHGAFLNWVENSI